MSPTLKLILMFAFLAYAAFRAFVYFRSKRPQFGIAVVFVCSIVTYEIVRVLIAMNASSGE